MVSLWPVRVSDAAYPVSAQCDPAVLSGRSSSPATESATVRGTASIPVPSPSSTPAASAAAPATRAVAAAAAQAIDPWDRCVSFFGLRPTPMPFETRMIWLVALAAALGSYVQLLSTFGVRVANGTFGAEWTWWYVLRMPLGAGLALIVYLTLRGGILTTTAVSDTVINPFGICGIAALVGLFSRQAITKLEEIFDTMFRTAGFQTQQAKPATPLAVTSVTPATFAHTAAPSGLAIVGTGFGKATKASINGAARQVTPTDDTHLSVQLAAVDCAAAGTLNLTLTNPTGPPVTTTVTVT
jgi:hypothetical protein